MKNIISIIILSGLLLFATHTIAQGGPPPPPGSGNTGNGGSAPPVPIDGGLGILLAAGAAYGAKKVYDLRKRDDGTSE